MTFRTVKILTYNILYGFHTLTNPPKFEDKRLALCQQIVKDENPDILVLTEACFGAKNQHNVLFDYAQLFGYSYCYYGVWGWEWGNCILSRYPFEGKLMPLGKRTAIRATVTISEKKLHLDIIHPAVEDTDDDKIEAVGKLLATKKEPYILTGDFNSLSDEDTYDRKTLLTGFKRFAKDKAEQEVARLLNRTFIPFLRNAGLTDAMPKNQRGYTIPTDLLGPHKESAMRIDFLFTTKDVKVVDSYIIRNNKTEQASDHYPLCTIIVV